MVSIQRRRRRKQEEPVPPGTERASATPWRGGPSFLLPLTAGQQGDAAVALGRARELCVATDLGSTVD